ncbi:flagellar assembly protein FliH [Marinobacterium aestuariivivens]|uniref:Flagellar assembly protein FliH n=1 Tax=Marinobacterium aestuariivivens TaxID=1698799 RepID=A0ABW1ZX47_9GAMM
MNPADKVPVRIRAADVGQVKPWQLPQVQGKHRIALVEREPETVEEQLEPEDVPFGDGKLTLAELERISEEARQEGLEEGRREGFEQGLSEGRAQGLKEGLQQGQQEIARSLERLGAMLDELEAPLASRTLELEHCLMQLVIQLAEAVTQHELGCRPELIRRSVDEALAQLPGEGGPVRIHVNPENEVLLQPLVESREHWSLVPDAAVTPGGCLLRTDNSRVDQTVESRFRQVADQLRERLAANPSDAQDL